MEALVRASMAPDYPAEIKLIICNRPDSGGIARAENLGVQCMTIDHEDFKTREDFERAMHAVLREAGIELIALAGFMRVLTPWFVSRWTGRMINIHPSLLPKFKGLNTHKRAIAAGEREHGASVHWVSEELDAGAVIDRAIVTVDPNETEESLARKVLLKEHTLYVSALSKAAIQITNMNAK